MTIIDTIADRYYGDRVKMAFAFADLLNQEAKALQADGVDVIQFDEPAFNVYMDEVRDWGIKALEKAAEGLTCATAVHICYGYGIKANTDWKQTLGGQWRQYEETFPSIDKSPIQQVAIECRNSKVPLDLLGLLKGKIVQAGVIDVANDQVETAEDVVGDDRGGREIRAEEQHRRHHQLRHGADAARHRGSQACWRSARARNWRGSGWDDVVALRCGCCAPLLMPVRRRPASAIQLDACQAMVDASRAGIGAAQDDADASAKCRQIIKRMDAARLRARRVDEDGPAAALALSERSDAAPADSRPRTRAQSMAASATSHRQRDARRAAVTGRRPSQRPALHDQEALVAGLHHRAIG